MSEPLPEPLTPPDCDLRGMPFMPVDLVRLFDSDLYALSTGDEFKAAFTLWGKAFLQVPAGSIPADDRILAHLSGAGSGWRKVREMALRGWVKASDGRLYHPVVAEKAREAWEARKAQRARTEAARQARAQRRQNSDNAATDAATTNATTHVTTSVTDYVTGSKGQGQGQGIKERTPQPPSADADGGAENSKDRRDERPRPDGWAGQRRGLRALGDNPRAKAASEAASSAQPPLPEPDHPLWPSLKARGVSAADFRAWIAPLRQDDAPTGEALFAAPTEFHAARIRADFALPLAAATGRRVVVVVAA